MDISALIAISLGAAWASGLNLYAAVLTLGLLGATGQMTLPPDLQILTHPVAIGAAAAMYCIEFFTDKVPGIDSTWDAIHTFIRIPAGAALAAGAVGDLPLAVQLGAVLLGGGVALTSHGVKAGARLMINTSPEPFSNWGASVTEDAAAVGGVWLAVFHPIAFAVLFVAFVALAIWLLPRVWRGLATLWDRLRGRGARREADARLERVGTRLALRPSAGDGLPPPER